MASVQGSNLSSIAVLTDCSQEADGSCSQASQSNFNTVVSVPVTDPNAPAPVTFAVETNLNNATPKTFTFSVNFVEQACGNGNLQQSLGEAHDDGNYVDGDGCDSNCKVECDVVLPDCEDDAIDCT